ncbi:unnamed protein product [Chrysoparadoxa australica]
MEDQMGQMEGGDIGLVFGSGGGGDESAPPPLDPGMFEMREGGDESTPPPQNGSDKKASRQRRSKRRGKRAGRRVERRGEPGSSGSSGSSSDGSSDVAQGAGREAVRLLKELGGKTDAMVLSLGQLEARVHGVEKTLESSASTDNGIEHTSATGCREGLPRSRSKSRLQPHQRTVSGSLLLDEGGTLWQQLSWMVKCGEVESAFTKALEKGTERDVLRLMGKTSIGAAGKRMGMKNRAALFSFIARMIEGNSYIDHVLPWVFGIVQEGSAQLLPAPVLQALASSLHHLAADPTSQGVMAARLCPYFQ